MLSTTVDHSLKRERKYNNNNSIDEPYKTFKDDCNFPLFKGKGNRHFLSFAPYTPMNPSKFGSCEDVNLAKLFLSTAPELKDAKLRNQTEKRPLFGIQKLANLNQIVFITCVFGELVVLFEEDDNQKNLILYHVGKFSNVNNISEHTTTITEISLPMLPLFSGEIECGTRKLTREDVVFFTFSCDYQRRVYFIQLRNGKVFARYVFRDYWKFNKCRGTNTFNELGLKNRCKFVEEWEKITLTTKEEYITTIKTNSHSSVFGTQNGKWYISGKDAYFLKRRMIDFDNEQIDYLEADELDPPYICSIDIPNETIMSVQQLFFGSFLVTKSGKVYSTFRERLSIITDFLKENSLHTLKVHYLEFDENEERTESIDSFQRECFLLDLPFPISEIRSIDNSMLITREEDKRLFVSKKSNLIDLEISEVRTIINSTDEFFIISKWNNIYSLYPSATIPKLKAIELPRELKQIPLNRPTKLRKTNQLQTSTSGLSTIQSTMEQEPVYNLWESCSSIEIRHILSLTTTFFVVIVEEAKGEMDKHFMNPMQDYSSLILCDMDIITQK